jgi:hypothetical protein
MYILRGHPMPTIAGRFQWSCLSVLLVWSWWANASCVWAAEEGKNPDVLALVEADQSTNDADQGQDGPDGRINLAAISFHYTHVSSYRDGGSAAPNAIDGNPKSAWSVAKAVTEAWIEVGLGAATPINRITLVDSGNSCR